ncbi:MAG: hypothetical protein KIS85_04135 [Anaerolineales bacterium]|nr:hypothetical protein [Anaerolineales bacterium]
MWLSLFGEQPKWHLQRLAAVLSLLLAFILRLWGTERWVDLFPVGLIGLLVAVWLKPLVYSRLEGFVQKQTRQTAGWFAAVAGTALLATLLSVLVTLLVSQVTYSEDLPLSIWLMDALFSTALVGLVYYFLPNKETRRPSTWQPWLAFSIFFLAGMGLVWKALAYPMTWDDLHLIRFFYAEHLLEAFRGNWEPDQIETPGYRPLTMAFNHFRYVLFREDVVAHRVFLVGLYAAFLTRVAGIAQRFGLAWSFAVFGGLLALAARHSVYHYVWLADGIHLFQGLLAVATLHLMLRGIESRQIAFFLYALFFGMASLLVREDNLVLIPLAVLLTVVYMRGTGASPATRRMAYAFTAALALMGAFILVVRGQWVESDPIILDLNGLVKAIDLSMFGFVGRLGFDAISSFLISGWSLVLVLCVLLLVKLRSRQEVLLWLAAAGAACLVGLKNDRVNLLLLTVTFFSFALAALFAAYAAISRPWRAAVTLLAATLLLGAAYVSHTAMEAFHPSASNVVYWNTEFIYGRFAHKATIPEERAQATIGRLAVFGIHQDDIPDVYQSSYLDADAADLFSQMVREALARFERRPNADGRFFVPLVEPFTP